MCFVPSKLVPTAPIHACQQMRRLEAKQVLLCPLISFDFFATNRISSSGNSHPAKSPLLQTASRQLPYLNKSFKHGRCCLPPRPHQMPTLVSNPLSTAGPTSLCFFNAGICQGGLSQSRETQYTLQMPLPHYFALNVSTAIPMHVLLKYKHLF